MIVRERSDAFVMIAQHDHAAISGAAAKKWKDDLFPGADKRHSVEFAIRHHDYGWKLMDETPFWDDATGKPFAFTDYPVPPKVIFYQYGIDETAKDDTYAAMLCSRHYSRFLQRGTSENERSFVNKEEQRRRNLQASITDFDEDVFECHYGMLQMLDDLSLFICLNEPGVAPEDSHRFFKKGISVADAMTTMIPEKTIDIRWQDKHTVSVNPFPFTESFQVPLYQRIVPKQAIQQKGLMASYRETEKEKRSIQIVPG